MKRSSSLSSRFSRSNFSYQSSIICAGVSIAFIAIACRSRTEPVRGAAVPTPVEPQTALVSIKEDIAPGWIPLRNSGSSSEIIAWLGARSCIQQELQIKTRFSSGFYSTDILIEQSWSGQSVSAQVDGINMTVAGGSFGQDVKDKVCEKIQSDGGAVTLPTSVAGQFKSAIELTLAAIAPDCKNIEATTNGWQCSLSTLMPQSAIVMIEDFQQAMIRRWSRQPYVLARRAGVTMSLARTATNLNNEVNLHKFCKLLRFSLPEELPLVMTSGRWQKSLCDGDDTIRREAAFHGLAKAAQELTMIRQLYESTSKVGMFSIRIPSADIPGQLTGVLQPLRVTITPNQEVTDRLIEVAESMLGRPPMDQRRSRRTASIKPIDVPPLEDRKPLCWHPMFSDSAALMRVADGMRLTGDGFKGECRAEAVPGDSHGADPLATYLMQSLTSETEFVMDNGQTKLLRLPEGQYQYIIEALPQNPVDAEDQVEDSVASTKGQLSWGTTRDHSIRGW